MIVLTAAGALLVGCSGPPGERDQVVSTARAWLAAVSAGDPAAECRLLSPAAQASAATGDDTCEQALGDLDLPSGGSVGAVEVWSDRAQVRTGPDTLFLVKVKDGWRVGGAGCEAQADRPYDCDVEG